MDPVASLLYPVDKVVQNEFRVLRIILAGPESLTKQSIH